MVEAIGARIPRVSDLCGPRYSSEEMVQDTAGDMQRGVSDRLNDIGQNLLPDTALDRLIGEPGALDRFVDPGHRPPPPR